MSIDFEIKNMLYKNSKNSKKSTTKYRINFIDDLDELEVHTVKDLSNYKDFKSLDIYKRLSILDNYLEKISLLDKDRLYLINLVKNNSLKNKTEIDYDKINGYIKNIKLLEYNHKLNLYIVKKSTSNNIYDKQISMSKKNINKLIHS
jgi:hypothetical protein|tara:strand:+ start:922 stop:1362 length:441 start_codon:yes stop_codon:yes gene_type:complete